MLRPCGEVPPSMRWALAVCRTVVFCSLALVARMKHRGIRGFVERRPRISLRSIRATQLDEGG